jgi:hypothetical protein
MQRKGFNPKTGESYRRLKMCFACIHGFHLSCAGADCTCPSLNHNSVQSAHMPHPAPKAPRRPQLAGAAIAS